MCVALPGRVEWIGDVSATSIPARIVVGNARHSVDLVMVPEARCGDYVIAHSGYAIRTIDEQSVDLVHGAIGHVGEPRPGSRHGLE